MSILDRIQEKIKQHSNSIAIIHEGRKFSYRELGNHANRLSNYLFDHQVREDDRVILFMRRSTEMLVSILATWQLKATYVPIDPDMPIERLKHILLEVNPQAIITEAAFLSRLVNENYPILTLTDPFYFAHRPFFTTEAENINDKLAYLIYTSGSTGQPKGVMITHDNVENYVSWLLKTCQLSSEDVVSFNSSLSFDFSVSCTIAPLAAGATILITSETDTLNLPYYFQQLTDHKVTLTKWTPSYFKLLVEYAEKYRPDLSSLHDIVIGGEQLLTVYVERWLAIYPTHTIINEYGPTETTVGSIAHLVTKKTLDPTLPSIPIGKVIDQTKIALVNTDLSFCQKGEVGELIIGGKGVGQGYYQQSALTDERFIKDFFASDPRKAYRTGDLVKQLPDDTYLYLGRMDHQVKINGYRVELSEIESHLIQHKTIKSAAVYIEKDTYGHSTLSAYLVLENNKKIVEKTIKDYLSKKIPSFMIPARYYQVDHIPLNKNGKIDYSTLEKQIIRPEKEKIVEIATKDTHEKSIIQVLKKYIALQKVDIKESLFSLGVTSLMAIQIVDEINQQTGAALKIQDLFFYSTIESLADYLKEQCHTNDLPLFQQAKITKKDKPAYSHEPIAIIAMDCRLPGADSAEALWALSREGKETISFFEPENLKLSDRQTNAYSVYAKGILKDIEYFDAEFFNFTPKEAHLTDPQHRLFLESSWIALEKAGYHPLSPRCGKIGVFASMNDSTYIIDHGIAQLGEDYFTNRFEMQRLMSPQFLATKVAYHLNCQGASFNLQTACSSSLVSVALACQQLSDGQCDMALAGGISIITPQDTPYFYQKGNIFSPDGHCRPFDANAAGTVFGNGLGVMVLKRLTDALRDRDPIISVIKGIGMNNDGAQKMSYAAPSIQGQAGCILAAQESAQVSPETIQYMEAHGTGTLLGDPIEIEALTRAFRTDTYKQQFCALGSLKANIGHTHVAAGIAGLMKAALALKHQQIPPAINYQQANPNIDFEQSPFYVNTRLQYWRKREATPRRAGVSSFGIGGTNAHVILEEAPAFTHYPAKYPYAILPLSAETKEALTEYHDKLIHFLRHSSYPKENVLADAAYTLQVGRKVCRYRSSIVCEDIDEAINKLIDAKENHLSSIISHPNEKQKLVFLFPGQGTEYLLLSKELYEKEISYKEYLDKCFNIASHYLPTSLKEIVFPKPSDIALSKEKLTQTQFIQPILFSIEYALAKLLFSWGIQPDYMLGHSLGEYVAACLSGVFSLEEAIKLVCLRGKAIEQSNKGAMLTVPLSKEKILPLCQDEVSIAALNAPNSCVISGAKKHITALQSKITSLMPAISSSVRLLKTAYPFHSKLLIPAADTFRAALQSIKRQAPSIPYLSNLTGTWIKESDVQQEDYWIKHMLETVQFSRCVQQVFQECSHPIFLEIGPGNTLLSLVQKHQRNLIHAIQTLPSEKASQKRKPEIYLGEALTSLWCYGYDINWEKYHQGEKRRRITLPTYPFQKKRYWFDEILSPKQLSSEKQVTSPAVSFYTPTWIREANPINEQSLLQVKGKNQKWIVFDNQTDLSKQIIQTLQSIQANLVIIEQGETFQFSTGNLVIHPAKKSHYVNAIETIIAKDIEHYSIIHLWSTNPHPFDLKESILDSAVIYEGFFSGLFLLQAFHKVSPAAKLSCAMVTTQLQSVLGSESIHPVKSTILSLCRVAELENKNVKISNIDVDSLTDPKYVSSYASRIIHTASTHLHLTERPFPYLAAFRHQYGWQPTHQLLSEEQTSNEKPLAINKNGVYLITGGLGGMGLTVADWLSQKNTVTIVLVSRTPFSPQKERAEWLKHHSENDVMSDKIRSLQTILERGSKIIIESGDITHYATMKAIVKRVEEKQAPINGIFHFAGIPGKGLAVLKALVDVQSVLSPKIEGIKVLAQLFKKIPLDFVCVSSSLTALAGGVGQIDYCAANIFLDYFMTQNPFEKCQRTITINWNAWQSVGMAANLHHSKTHSQLYQNNSVTPKEGIAILEQLFTTNLRQVMVSRFSPNEERKRIIQTFQTKIDNKLSNNKSTKQDHRTTRLVVMDAWKKILGVKSIRDTDTFYSLGGDSLLTIQLIALLEKQLNISLTLHDLSKASTVEAMIKLIECRPIHSDTMIIPLSSTDTSEKEKTIYFIHPIGGTIFCYLSLVPHLNKEFTCYAIQDPEISEQRIQFQSIKEMAECYADNICQQKKSGDIILAGFSFGGNIAMEMVEKITKRGLTVEKVILIDSWANLSTDLCICKNDYRCSNTPESMKMIQKYYGIESYQYQTIERRLSWLRNYAPLTVDVPVILLKAEDALLCYKNISSEDYGWQIFCRNPLTKYTIPGNHDTIFNSNNLNKMSKLLAQAIE